VVRFGIQLPRDEQPVGATGSTIALSPDGSRIVYVGKAPSGQRLYSRGLDQVDPVSIAGTDGAILPFFSPDGQWLGFKAGDHLMKVALAGGPVLPLCSTGGATYGATWTPSDSIIFASDSGLMVVPAAGGSPHLLARPDSGEALLWPDAVRDGRMILFTAMLHGGVHLATLDRRTRRIKRLQQAGACPHYVTAGFVVISDPSGIISAVPFDTRKAAVTGPAVPLADKLGTNANGDVNLGVSRTGAFAFQSSVSSGSRLVFVDRNGAVRDAGSDTGLYVGPRLSSDGRRVALGRWTDENFTATDVWVLDLAQHTRTRLTFGAKAAWPVWSPDGRRIAYAYQATASESRVYWVPSDGSGEPDSLGSSPGLWFPAVFTPDGRSLLFHGIRAQQSMAEIWELAPDRGAAPKQILASAFHDFNPTLSPDGRWMAYVSDESGRWEIYVRPFPGPGGRWQVSLDLGTEPVWSHTGREIFYRSGDRMMAAAVRTQGGFEVGGRTELFEGAFDQAPRGITNYDVTRDGKTFVMLQQVTGAAQSV
jgi:Tol biopolymer transport system component